MLEVGKCPLRADEIDHLKGAKRLYYLRLLDESCSDGMLQAVSKVPNIASLSLSGENVTDEMVTKLHGMKQLRELDLSSTNVTQKGVDALKKELPLVQVRHLRLDQTDNKTDKR